jgi:hypothetical protein
MAVHALALSAMACCDCSIWHTVVQVQDTNAKSCVNKRKTPTLLMILMFSIQRIVTRTVLDLNPILLLNT